MNKKIISVLLVSALVWTTTTSVFANVPYENRINPEGEYKYEMKMDKWEKWMKHWHMKMKWEKFIEKYLRDNLTDEERLELKEIMDSHKKEMKENMKQFKEEWVFVEFDDEKHQEHIDSILPYIDEDKIDDFLSEVEEHKANMLEKREEMIKMSSMSDEERKEYIKEKHEEHMTELANKVESGEATEREEEMYKKMIERQEKKQEMEDIITRGDDWETLTEEEQEMYEKHLERESHKERMEVIKTKIDWGEELTNEEQAYLDEHKEKRGEKRREKNWKMKWERNNWEKEKGNKRHSIDKDKIRNVWERLQKLNNDKKEKIRTIISKKREEIETNDNINEETRINILEALEEIEKYLD